MLLKTLWFFVFLANFVDSFLIGGCIGPKKAFEKYLTGEEKQELAKMIEDNFNGRNKDQMMQQIFVFLKKRLTAFEWEEIQPEIAEYQKKNFPCSPYSQLLPPKYFSPLMKAVRRAVETGADKAKIKYLVEDYLDRILFTKEFAREYRKQPPIDENKPKPVQILRPQQIRGMPVYPPFVKLTNPSKPIFPIVEIWKVFPQKPRNEFYQIG